MTTQKPPRIRRRAGPLLRDRAINFGAAFMLTAGTAIAATGDVITTPQTPMELPIEVEIELSPAGSLKQAPLWKELVQLLKNPYAPVERRPGFGVPMPPLNVYPLDYNFLTGQPLRLRTSDGEISWDQPGPLFDPDEVVTTDAYNTPTQIRTIIGHLVACPDDPPYEAVEVPVDFCDNAPAGSLVVHNTSGNDSIPPDGTVVAVMAFFDGMLHELDPDTQELEPVVDELEQPVNEEHFFRDPDNTAGVPGPQRPLIGRPAAEILGKALFWDMQVGSDGVQACASCHFHAGADNRTRGQLNPNTLGGDLTLQVKGPNQDVVPNDFPFHKRVVPDVAGDGTDPAIVVSDANDVMSSMGVSQFKLFDDIPPPGGGAGSAAFIQVSGPVKPLAPDQGTVAPDPVPVNNGLRRVEPRNTPTFHGAAFNLDNFWDSRARFNFNGGSVFGPSDPQFHIWVNNGNGGGPMHGLPNPDEETIELSLFQWAPEPGEEPVPVRIKFSSLGSQSVGPPISDFEMSFLGRSWPKIGKKLLQNGVTPLANQQVSPSDSVLGLFSNGARPGISLTYPQLIRLAFDPELWANNNQHFTGCYTDDGIDAFPQNSPACPAGTPHDPFDGYVLSEPLGGGADATDTNQFNQMEANFPLFFALAVQAYESLTIPDDTPADRFFDANPNAGHGVGEPGDQAVLFPTLVPDLVDDGLLNNSEEFPTDGSVLTLVPGFGADEVFGFDIFAGANLTAALPAGSSRNPIHTITTESGDELEIAVGSNPFTRSAKCMLCHLGPEQTDHSINIAHGLLKNDAEFEYPTPPITPDPSSPSVFADGMLPAPEPSGSSRTVGGLILAEEVTEGQPQDAVEVEPRNFATFDDPATPWDDRVVSQPSNFAFGDQGVYNIGLRPSVDDIGRGGDDPFGWPLSLAALTLKNIGGPDFEPNDSQFENNVMENFDPEDLEATFEETGDGAFFPGTTHTLQSINPGFERGPMNPQMPEYMAPWINDLPAGELHPQIDEMAGMVPNTLTPPNGGPGIEFPEILFGADFHCALYDPAQFGSGPPNFGWGAPDQDGLGEPSVCPQNQSGVAGNFDFPVHGTWPVPNRVLREGAFKAPPLRNVELTGPYFHTGSYLTLRQVIDFYMRGGDFPITNAENRDPNIQEIEEQAFGFGRTSGDDLDAMFSYTFPDGLLLEGTFADGLPDTVFRYDEYPDSDHPYTPEPAFASREAALEDAKNALVKFLIALTDPRVKLEQAPFDHPEIFVPIDGAAPENTGGPSQLVSLSGVPCTAESTGMCFRRIPAVGAAGRGTPLPNFLEIASTPSGGCDHFDQQCGDAPAIAPEPVLTGFQVAIGLDSSLTQGLQLGKRFVARGKFETARQRGNRLRFEARGQVDSQVVSATFTPADPAVLRVAPPRGKKAMITVEQCGIQTGLTVASQAGSRQLQITTICEADTIRAEITQ